MTKLLIGSNNPAKLATFKLLLDDYGFDVVSPKEIGINEDVEETGKTFEENALLKAKFYHEKSGLPTLADDGGIEIDALDGAPGVYSHRWAGEPPEGVDVDQHLLNTTLEKMKDVPAEKRTAQLASTLCLILPGKEPVFVNSGIKGHITSEQQAPIRHGFPYRSIFVSDDMGKLLALATEEDLKRFDHRKNALKQLDKYLRS